MKKICLLLCFFLAFSNSLAKPRIFMDSRAHKFLKERHSIKGHRLGFNNSSLKKDSKKAFIVEADTTRGMQSIIKLALKKNKYNVSEDGGSSLVISDEKFRISLDGLKKDESKFSEKLINKLLPSFLAKQFDFIVADTEYDMSLTTGEVTERGYVFHYQRVYNNRIVRSGGNYLRIALDSKGSLRWADISMTDLRTSLEYVETTEDVAENESALDSIVSTSYSTMTDDDLQKEVAVSSVTANSAAEAYCPIEDEGKVKLFPCISYVSNIVLENNESITTILDAPHSHKHLKNYKKGKRKHIHFAGNSMGNNMFVFNN